MGGKYNVSVGRHVLADNTTGQIIPMQQEIIHPDWDQYTDEYDFALVVLEHPTDVETASIVSINSENNLPKDGSYVTTMGWGDTTIDDEVKAVSDSLMAVDVEVISNDDCRQVSGTDGMYTNNYINYIFPSMICTLTPGQDACQGECMLFMRLKYPIRSMELKCGKQNTLGDSGGPLIIPGEDSSQDIQIGVVSWGIGCARMFPGV